MNYDFRKGNLETPEGINFNFAWCQEALKKFPDPKSVEHKIFQKVLQECRIRLKAEWDSGIFKV